jgi:GNAT superfamily N-acetyltransferase
MVHLRVAKPGDEQTIFDFVRGLADYERLAHELEATPRQIADALFAKVPRVFCDIAQVEDEAVGFALWFYTFSTFRGKHGIYLEDLFVKPECRGLGVGKALLAGLARRCIEENLGRLEWAVLDWNEPAIAFYRANGARLLDDWTTCRLEGRDLLELGRRGAPMA